MSELDQRFYTSQFGRFMSADRFVRANEVEDSGSWNKYSYVGGDPVNFFDPFGLTKCDSNGNNCFDSVTVSANTPLDYESLLFLGGQSGAPKPRPNPDRDAFPGGATSAYTTYGLYNLGKDLAGQVNGTSYTNCQALGDYAGAAAYDNNSAAKFVNDFTNLIPGLNGNTLVLYNGGDNGFLGAYQNTVNDSPQGNGDQAHHFAGFLLLGYNTASSGVAGLGAIVWEQLEAAANGGPVNAGDVALGIQAAMIGAGLRNGTTSVSGAVKQVQGLCK